MRDLSRLTIIEVAHIHPLRRLRANRVVLRTNEVNFAERPLAGIHAKLTMLRDNFVVAMV